MQEVSEKVHVIKNILVAVDPPLLRVKHIEIQTEYTVKIFFAVGRDIFKFQITPIVHEKSCY